MFRVLGNAYGEWSGHDGDIALWIGGAWQFLEPDNGLAIFDKTANVQMRYNSGWEIAAEPGEPEGGATVDAEARAAISGLIAALRTGGLFANTAQQS